jgi:hypothetical protein
VTISSRTPEGDPQRCAICNQVTAADPSYPLDDACCAACGSLLLWFRDRLAPHESLEELESLEGLELVMELGEKFDVEITDEDAAEINTIADAIRYLRRRHIEGE